LSSPRSSAGNIERVHAPVREEEPLLAELQDLFESARELVAGSLAASKINPVVTVDQLLVETNADRTGWGIRQTQIDVNVLAVTPRFDYRPTLDEWVPRAYDLAARLEQQYRDSLPLGSPLSLIGGELVADEWLDRSGSDEPRRVLSEFILAPTRWYLTNVQSAATGDPELARKIASEVLEILRTGECLVRQSVPLERLEPAADLSNGRVRIRVLSPVERGEYVEPSLPKRGSRYGHLMTGNRMSAPTAELEVDTVCKDTRQFSVLPAPAMLVALQLHQVPLIGPGVVLSRIRPEWYSVGTSGRPVPMRQAAIEVQPYELNQAQFAAACQTAERLKAYRIDDPQRAAELALRRFNLGCGREDFADALVDFVVALEALLLPYDDQTRNTELSYRFRMHGAHFVAGLPAERSAIFDQLRHLYGIRSRLVHGGNHPTISEIRSAERDAFSLAARGLLKAVNEGFPDAVHFRRILLGETGI
jgi:Apea-like HEPN